jgi:hypothetical protein
MRREITMEPAPSYDAINERHDHVFDRGFR